MSKPVYLSGYITSTQGGTHNSGTWMGWKGVAIHIKIKRSASSELS